MKSWKRTLGAGLCTVALVAGAAPAGADQVVNTVDSTIDNAPETMNLTVGGGAGNTTIWVNATEDRNEGSAVCNIGNLQKLVLNVVSTKPGIATVPTTIEIKDCGKDKGASLSVTPVAAGTSKITFSVNSATTASGDFDLLTARFDANVAAASSPPPPPPPADTTAPTWECTPTAPSSGWQASEGSHACTASDPSGLKAGSPATFTLSTSVGAGNEDGSASTGGQLLCDVHDNCTTAGPISGWKVDRKAPSISDDGPTTQPNGDGWHKADVTNTFSALDGGSGLASSVPSSFARTTTGEGTAVTVSSGSVADAVGNSNPGIDSAVFQIDKTAPTVTCDSPTPVYLLNAVAPAAVTATVTDGLSGPKNSTVSVAPDVASVGTRSVSLAGEDVAGNTTPVSCSYSVVYDSTQILQPINSNGSSAFKLNSTIPVKIKLVNGSAGVSNANITISVTKLGSSTTPDVEVEDPFNQTPHSGNTLRYDSTNDQYIFNLATKPLGTGNYRVNLNLGGGKVVSQTFSIIR